MAEVPENIRAEQVASRIKVSGQTSGMSMPPVGETVATETLSDQPAVRVPGTNWLPLPGRAMLFMNDKELINVTDDWFTQEQRRFNLKDIRAIVARRLPGWTILNVFLMFVILIFFLIGTGTENYWIVGVSGLFLFILFLNILPGPTCSCHIWTAVSTARLPAVVRVAGFRKMIRSLRPRIEAIQGVLTDEEFAAATAGAPTESAASIYRQPRCRLGVHYLSYFMMTVQSLLGFVLLEYQLIWLIMILVLAQFIFISIALSRQAGTDVGVGLTTLMWLTLLWTIIGPLTMMAETNWANFIGSATLAVGGLLACYSYTMSARQ